MKSVLAVLALAAAVACFSVAVGFAAEDTTPKAAGMENMNMKTDALSFTMKDIDGKDVDLGQYRGKVVLIVNVASKCGNTPQYAPLEAVYTKYQDKGLVIMGFPENNFGHQEPGTEAQIKAGCMTEYHVTFPMFSKVSVKGDDQVALFKYLTSQDVAVTAPDKKEVGKGDIAWNFEKFLIGRDGKVVARFANKTQPDDPEVIKAIEGALASKAG